VERPKPSSGAQSPLATVPEDHPTEPIAGAPPGGFFVTNPDESQGPLPDPPAQAESTPFSSFGNALSGSNLLGAVSSGFGWSGLGGKKEDKSKPTTPRTSMPAWGGGGGFGSVPSVTESTGGGGGWGAATGNSAWGSMLGGKSGNGSAADLLDGAGITDPSAQETVQNGEPFSSIPLEGTPAPEAFAQEGDMSQEAPGFGGPGFMEPLTVQTDVGAEPGADTTGPTTAAADSPEVETREGDGGGQGGEEQQPEDDEWALPVKSKKKKGGAGAAAPTTQAGGASAPAGDDGFAAVGGKKKKGKKGGR